MSRQIQIRRGTAAENDAFTGAIGEITMDTTNNTLRVHDGETVGGTILAKQSDVPSPIPDTADYVVESQLPTPENNYTWYRKYKSGWLEQGGKLSGTSITFPVEFLYTPTVATSVLVAQTTSVYNNCFTSITTTGFQGVRCGSNKDWFATADLNGTWYACGVAANNI